MPIRAVDETNGVATLAGDPRPSNKENNAQYFIENAPDALDRPGEWYLNRKTGVLTYWAEPGEDLRRRRKSSRPPSRNWWSSGAISASKRPVANVVLRGLTFAHTDCLLGTNGYADTQAAFGIAGDVRAEAAVDCVVENCVFTHLAGYGLDLGQGCQQWRVVRNEFLDLGAGGIAIGETTPRDRAVSNQCHHHVITDNHLHHLGRVYAAAVGVLILQSGNNRVAHNHIHDLYYTAISVGWNWGYQETPATTT